MKPRALSRTMSNFWIRKVHWSVAATAAFNVVAIRLHSSASVLGLVCGDDGVRWGHPFATCARMSGGTASRAFTAV